MNTATEAENQIEVLPDLLTVGRRVYCGFYWAGHGTITAIDGKPDPASVRSLCCGTMVTGGRAMVTICYDNGRRSKSPESIIRTGDKFLPEVVGPEAVAAAVAACDEFEREANRKEEEASRARDERRKLYATSPEFAHLEKRRPGGPSDHALAAKNIRAELRRRWPGVKFSVTSESFSGGNAIDVKWSLGPTEKQVQEITSRHKEGSFDGMHDIYENDRENVFCEIFGGSKYIHEVRRDEAAHATICAALCKVYGVEVPADGQFWRIDDKGELINRRARELLAETAFPVGAVVTGAEYVGEGLDMHLVVTFTAPEVKAAPAAESVPLVSSGAALVVLNAEKNGVEIRFPSKPAAAVLDSLKAAGWRWSRFSGCWYHADTPAALEFAARVTSC